MENRGIEMITVDELFALIDTTIASLPAINVPLDKTTGLRLEEQILAAEDEPAFDRSAMDGFAIAEDAQPGSFSIIGEILPGQAAMNNPDRGEAIRVFTGSALPPKVKVVMQEDVTEKNGGLIIESLTNAGHVRHRGSALEKGNLLLSKNTILSPASIALLASAGVSKPRVIPRPQVAHLTTGSEIVPFSSVPKAGQIRNANAPLIRALVEATGAIYCAHYHVDESLASAMEACEHSLFQKANLLLVSGGSSGGQHDHTAELLEKLGFTLMCRTVNCRPGKPFILGVRGSQVAIGLPGNPVSHFVTFHLFVRHVLSRLAGWRVTPKCTAILREGEVLVLNQRETFWPGSVKDSRVTPLPWLDSGHLAALLQVNALIRIPASTIPLVGSSVEIIPC